MSKRKVAKSAILESVILWIRGDSGPVELFPEAYPTSTYEEFAGGYKRAFTLVSLAGGRMTLVNHDAVQAVMLGRPVTSTSPGLCVWLVGRQEPIYFQALELGSLLSSISFAEDRVTVDRDDNVEYDVEGTGCFAASYYESFVDLWSSADKTRLGLRLKDVARVEISAECWSHHLRSEKDADVKEEKLAARKMLVDAQGLTDLPPEVPCPCGSGLKHRRCCKNKAFSWKIDSHGKISRVLPLNKELQECLNTFKRRFEESNGRSPGPGDEVFPPKDLAAFRKVAVEVMKKVGTHPSLVYAYEKTGMLVTEESRRFMSGADMMEHQAYIEEWYSLHPQE